MILKWHLQIIDQIVYLDHMGKNRFSKTLKIFLSETTRLIALVFCVALFSRYLPFCSNYAHEATNYPAPSSHVLHRPWVGLQCVIVVFPDHTHLLFFIMDYMNKYCLKPLSLYRALLFDM